MAEVTKSYSIGFDAKRVVHNATGLGNYSRYFVEALAKYAPDFALHLYSYDRGNEDLYSSLSSYPSVAFHHAPRQSLGFPGRSVYYRNYQVLSDLRRDRIQLYHGLSNELPSGIKQSGIPSVVTIHDLIYERFPGTYSPVDVLLYRHKYRRSCRDASHIVAVSESTRRDLMEFYAISPDKISVIYQGCDPIFTRRLEPSEIRDTLSRYGLRQPYLLTVGTIERRKNAALIVSALGSLPHKELTLVLIGRETPYAQEVRETARRYGVSDRLLFLYGVPTADLPALYAGAEIFVYPSLFEGFGIPILEALSVGVPVIGATGSSLQEVGGADSLYCDPYDADSLAHLIDRIYTDALLARQMIDRGRQHATLFSQETLAHDLRSLYLHLL